MRPRLSHLSKAAILLLAGVSTAWSAEEYRRVPTVKVTKIHPLPYFCIAEGLEEGHLPPKSIVENQKCDISQKKSRKSGSASDSPHKAIVPTGNAEDIVAKLQPSLAPSTSGSSTVTAAAAATGTASATATGSATATQTQFALSLSADKKKIVILCRAEPCDHTGPLEHAINDLATPKYSYFQDFPVDSREIGNALAKAVPVINPKLTAEVLHPGQLRIESAKTLSEAELIALNERLKKDTDAIVAALKPEKDPTKDELKGSDPDVQVLTADLPFFCQPNSLSAPSELPKDDKCSGGATKVPAGNIEIIIQAVNTALGTTAKFKLSKDGNRILIACDAACAGDSVKLIQATIAASARPSPQYVEVVEVPRGTAQVVAKSMTSPPITASVLTDTTVRLASDLPVASKDLDYRREYAREKGFGPPELPLLHRMFYRSAPNVVGDLLTTPAAETWPALGANAALAPVTSSEPASTPSAATSAAAASPASAGSSTPGTTISITNNPAPAAAAPAPMAPATPGPAPLGTVGQGMTAVGDEVVFTDTSSPSAVQSRVRLLTLLDFPRPEVLMNLWSLQASSPNGPEVARNLQKVRDAVSENNDALQHAVDYGWAYLSRQIKSPDFFDQPFYRYLTERFVADTEDCESGDPGAKNCLTDAQRRLWGLCPKGQYCLGFTDAFQPLQPTLTNIILAMMAARSTPETVLTTIACMEGKFEVYGEECFPDRNALWSSIPHEGFSSPDDEARDTRRCMSDARSAYLEKAKFRDPLNCDLLDRAAISAQKTCHQPATLPLSCFTIQAAKSFLPVNSFSTFSLARLDELAEARMADVAAALPPQESTYSASSLGLLRSAVADFLFNYKVSQQYSAEFGSYSLSHSAQQLNALFNPLVIAFNQDVSALSASVMEQLQDDLPNQNSFWELWRHNKTYVANGMVMVRGISGVESLVDTDTQNAFDSTQAQTLSAVLASLMSPGASVSTSSATTNTNTNSLTVNGAGVVVPTPPTTPKPGPTCSSNPTSPLCEAAILLRGTSTAGGIATALAALTPTPTHSIIGRQLTLDIIPHTLPGASSAELDVRLWAQEDSAPTIYSSAGSSSDFQSRVARHNVSTRVRVESVKLFDISSMTAMVQRPRAKLPIIPPFIEIPIIHNLLSVPLPAAKIYHASSAIVSAIIVPTAADLAYGLVFKSDRGVFPEDRAFSHLTFSIRTFTSQRQLPPTVRIYRFHDAMTKCLASSGVLAVPASNNEINCGALKFSDLPPER